MIQRLIQILLVRLPFESKDVMNVTRDEDGINARNNWRL